MYGGFMTTTRHARLLAATLLAACLLGACGSSDDKPTIKPTSDAPSSQAAPATPDPDGFSPEQREVADVVQSYTTAIYGRGEAALEPAALQPLVTTDLLDTIVSSEKEAVDDPGLHYVGDVTLSSDSVTIDGDTATFKGCLDGGSAFLAEKGETAAGPESTTVGITDVTITLVRDSARWVISDPQGEEVSSC
jgi:hypothetical protein